MKSETRNRNIRRVVWSAVALFLLHMCLVLSAAGSAYYGLSMQALVSIKSPVVILQNGTENVATVNADNTTARISIDANSTPTTYNYSLKIENNVTDSWQVRLEYLDHTNIDKVNTTITLHNDSTSSQQLTIIGANVSQSNDYFVLTNNATIYLAVMSLTENYPAQTAILQTCLRIRTLNTTTYTFYAITFEFA